MANSGHPQQSVTRSKTDGLFHLSAPCWLRWAQCCQCACAPAQLPNRLLIDLRAARPRCIDANDPDSSVDRAYSSAIPFSANSFFAFSFLAKCIRPMPRSTLGALVTTEMRPGPLRLALENQTDVRTLPSVWIAGETLHQMLGKRKPFLTAKRLLTNQIFRDIYRTDTLDVDQGLKLTSLTFLFTDLKGSTELYDRVGDLVAYDLVRAHFRVLNEIVASEAGAVVKTIGDAVMATFPTGASFCNAKCLLLHRP